jgi:uncharacterized repeat protein (TIGR02543 family)
VLGDLQSAFLSAEANGTPYRVTSDVLTLQFEEDVPIAGLNAADIFEFTLNHGAEITTFGAITKDESDPEVWGRYFLPIEGHWEEGDIIESIKAEVGGLILEPDTATTTKNGGDIVLHRDITTYMNFEAAKADGVAYHDTSDYIYLTFSAIEMPAAVTLAGITADDITLSPSALGVTKGALALLPDRSDEDAGVWVYKLEIGGANWEEGDIVTIIPNRYDDDPYKSVSFIPASRTTVLHREKTIHVDADNFEVTLAKAEEMYALGVADRLAAYAEEAGAEIIYPDPPGTGDEITDVTVQPNFEATLAIGTYPVTFTATSGTDNRPSTGIDTVTVMMTVYEGKLDIGDPDPGDENSTGSALQASDFSIPLSTASLLSETSSVEKAEAYTWIWKLLSGGAKEDVLLPTNAGIAVDTDELNAIKNTIIPDVFPLTFTANGREVTVQVTVTDDRFKVSYNANGGMGNVPNDILKYFRARTVTVLFSPLPTREGYTFLGWAHTANATTATYSETGSKSFAITGDTTLYAVWNRNIDGGGGTTNNPTPTPTPPNPNPTSPPAVEEPEPRTPEEAEPEDSITTTGTDIETAGPEGFNSGDMIKFEAQTGNIFKDLMDGNIPLGNLSGKGAWSLLSLLMSLIAAIISIVLSIGLFRGSKKEEDFDTVNSEEEVRSKKKQLLTKLLAIIVGVVTIVLWLILDDLSDPVVWINKWTLVIGLVFAAHIVLLVLCRSTHKIDRNSDDGKFADTYATGSAN